MPRPTLHRFRSEPVVPHQKRTTDVLQKPDNLKSYRQRVEATFLRKYGMRSITPVRVQDSHNVFRAKWTYGIDPPPSR
jgi:hypothetical protein